MLGDGNVVAARPLSVGGREALLVARYDRERSEDGQVRRVHQDDFCQALGVPAAAKYQSEGGPSIERSIDLLRSAADAGSLLRFIGQVLVSFLVGNNDAHGKNYSLIHGPGGGRATLAPAYGIPSTVVYNRRFNLSRKLAMSIGGENRPEYLERRHLDRFAADNRLGRSSLRRMMLAVAEQADAAAAGARDDLAEVGWERPIIDEITTVIGERSRIITRLARPA